MFTIKNASATTPRIFHLSFDKQGQPDIVKFAQEKMSLPSGFPKQEFLALFEEWKLARNNPDPTNGGNDKTKYFGLLRDMHQQYGINKASITYGSEEEMLVFGEYVRKAKTITDSTRGAIVVPPRDGGDIIAPPRLAGEIYVDNENGQLFEEFGTEFSTAKITVNGAEYKVKRLTRATKEVRMSAKADIYVIELDKSHNTDTNSNKLYFKKESGKWVPALATADSYSMTITGSADKIVHFTSKNSRTSSPSPVVTTSPVVPTLPSVAPAAPTPSPSSPGTASTPSETNPAKTPLESPVDKEKVRDEYNKKNIIQYKARLDDAIRKIREIETLRDDLKKLAKDASNAKEIIDAADALKQGDLRGKIEALRNAKDASARTLAVIDLQKAISRNVSVAADGWFGEKTMQTLTDIVTFPSEKGGTPASPTVKEKADPAGKSAANPSEVPVDADTAQSIMNYVGELDLRNIEHKKFAELITFATAKNSTSKEINALRTFLGLPAGVLDASVLTAVKKKVAEMNGKGEKKDAHPEPKPDAKKPTEKAPATATGIIFPEGFSAEDKALIEKEYAGLLDPKKIKIEGGPKGSAVEKIEAYELGVEITLKGVTGKIQLGYDSETKSVDLSHQYFMIEGSPYDVTWDQKNTLSLKPSDITDLQKRFPGFFPTTKIRLTGEFPSDFPEGKIKAVAMSSLVFVIEGENGTSINSATIAEDNKAIQDFNRIPYTLTADPQKGTIDFKKMVSDEDAKKIYEAFGLKGDEEYITVNDKRNVTDKVTLTDFSITQEGLLDMTDTPAVVHPALVGKKIRTIDSNSRETEYFYDKNTKILTLEDTPRQKIIERIRDNANITAMKMNKEDPNKIDVTINKDTFTVSLAQAKIIIKYFAVQTNVSAHVSAVRGDATSSQKIQLTSMKKDDKDNLILGDANNNINNNNEFTLVISKDGQTIVPMIRRNGYGHALKAILGYGGKPTDSQQALIEDIKKTARE